MTEIQIRDPDPEPGAPSTAPAADPTEPAPESPYKNLLVPLVVVPALIVMVLVLVFTLFGAVAGKEPTIEENLENLLHGGKKQREHALFNLVLQVVTDWEKAAQGEPGFEPDPALLPELRKTLAELPPIDSADDVPEPLALALILARQGDVEAVERLMELVGLEERLDPDGAYRFSVVIGLGTIGERIEPDLRARVAERLIPVLDGPDAGLRSAAAIALQALPSDRTVPALEGVLADASIELRLNGALSLARLGARSAIPVLKEMTALAPYEAERGRDPKLWARQQRVSESRIKALEALAAFDGGMERAELDRLGSEDPDPNVREAARRLAEGTRDEER